MSPTGIAIDAQGSFLLVSDANILRRVDVASGLVTTLAGNPVGYPLNRGHADGTATAASFNNLDGVAMDAAATFAVLADTDNNILRHIVISSGLVSTLSGNLSAGYADGVLRDATFGHPHGVAMTASGAVAFISDGMFNLMRRVDLSSGVVTTVAGSPQNAGSADGVGPYASLNYPRGLSGVINDVDGGSRLYLADAQVC